MTISLSNNVARKSYAVAQGVTQSSFTVSFAFFDAADLNVYVDDVEKTLNTDYTVTGGDGSTGSVSISVTGATGGSTVVITRDIELKRTTDFPPSGPFAVATLNTELDKLVAISADLNDLATRSIVLSDSDSTATLTLPSTDQRKSKYLAFDTNGSLIATSGTADVTPINSALNTFVQSSTVAAARAELLTGSNLTIPNDAGSNSTIQSTGDIQLTPDATGKVFVTTDNAESFQAGNVKIEDNLISAANAQGELRLEPNGAGPLLINGAATVTEDTGTGTILSVHGTSTQGMIELVSEASGTVSSADVGKIQFNMTNNQATFKRCAEIAVTADGATNSRRGGNFIFRTRDNNATAMTEHMRLTRGGRLGIGTLAPASRLHVDDPNSNSQACTINSSLSSFQGQVLKVTSVRTTTNSSFNFFLCGTDKLAIRDSGNVVNTNNSYGQFSDQRLKENIKDASSQWDDIKALQVRNFNFIDDDLTQIGVVAQELEAAGMSGLVEESKMSEPDKDGNDVVRKNVKYSVLYMKAVKALQEAITKIEALEARVTTLENA
mgnify:CR=1 FL=1|tara:strand:+ start:49 stop:1704 length:1656 start_codon:yes stop_codon:yes gene_type:complete